MEIVEYARARRTAGAWGHDSVTTVRRERRLMCVWGWGGANGGAMAQGMAHGRRGAQPRGNSGACGKKLAGCGKKHTM
jgi:hypothetical protein